MFEGIPKVKKEEPKKEEPVQSYDGLPEELHGKTPSEIYNVLKEEHERVLKEEKDKMGDQGNQQNKTPIDPFTGKPMNFNMPQNYQQNNQYSSGNQGNDDDDEPLPGLKGFMDKQLEKRMGPLVNQTFSSIRAQNRNYLQQKIGSAAWDKYGEEIEQLVGGMTPQVQIDPRAYEQAYKFVQANHLDEIAEEKARQIFEEQQAKLQAQADAEYEDDDEETDIEQEKQEAKRSSLFQGNTGTPHVGKPATRSASSSGQKKGKRKLSQEEKAVAERFGMTDDEYREMASMNTDTVSSLGL